VTPSGPRAGRVALLVLAAAAVSAIGLADRYDAQVPEKPQRYVTDRAGVFGPGQA